MKIQTTKKLLLSLVLCGLGFVALDTLSSASPPQGKIQAKKPIQLGYGHAPHPPLGEIQAKKLTQLGYGHAPHPPLGVSHQAKKRTQQGYGHAPYPPLGVSQVHRASMKLVQNGQP